MGGIWWPPRLRSMSLPSRSQRTSMISTSPGLRLTRPRRRETFSSLRRRRTNHLSRGRLIRLLLTHRFWPPSRPMVKEAYKPSEQRKADQAAVDAQVLAAIKAHGEGAVLKQYLGATFALSKGEFPHKMQF